MYKYVLSIYLEQNDSRKQATFKTFGGNFLISVSATLEQLLGVLTSNFSWIY